MAEIPSARQSPRIHNGVLKWYEGDTFGFSIAISLEDQDGETVNVNPGDTVEVEFRDRKNLAVTEFTFANVQNNTVSLDFDDTVTALFRKGEYQYDVVLNHGDKRTTIAKDNDVVVE